MQLIDNITEKVKQFDRAMGSIHAKIGNKFGAEWPDRLPDRISDSDLRTRFLGDPRLYLWKLGPTDVLSLMSLLTPGGIAIKFLAVLYDFSLSKTIELGLLHYTVPRDRDEIYLNGLEREFMYYLSSYKMAQEGYRNVTVEPDGTIIFSR